MALNTGLALRSSSPTNSDGSLNQGGSGKEEHDYTLIKDKSFRRYAASVDRTLALFDTTLQEWADYISFLSRLLKALQSHPKGVFVIPSKLLVAKRLAQCLHPSLPSGVHQKALEVYDFVFSIIRTDGLIQDLGVYLPGIASTLSFASSSVRPLFLSLIENHVLQVPVHVLRPALKALILTLLPGLEEESSDEFEKTLQTLHKIQHAFKVARKGELFWQNLFLASITSSARRPGVLVFLNKYLPDVSHGHSKAGENQQEDRLNRNEVADVTTPEPGLLLRCFATGLSDEQALVKRGFLDLLAARLPLHAQIFCAKVVTDDLDLLITAAVSVVLKRDMSLNRRLWNWFLGPEESEKPKVGKPSPSSETSTAPEKENDMETVHTQSYFQTFCARPLIRTLEAMLGRTSQASSKMSQPFRIALSLMDQWEIGNCVANAMFLPLMGRIRSYEDIASSRVHFQEVFRSASAFFDGVESNVIWSKMLDLVISTGKTEEDILRDLDLAAFIVVNFKVAEEEMAMLHIPLVSLAMLENLATLEQPSYDAVWPSPGAERCLKAFSVLRLFAEKISDGAFVASGHRRSKADSDILTNDSAHCVYDKVKSFFDQDQDSVRVPESPYHAETCAHQFLHFLQLTLLREIKTDLEGSLLQCQTQILFLLIARISPHEAIDPVALVRELNCRLVKDGGSANAVPFSFVSSCTILLVGLLTQLSQDQDSQYREITSPIPELVRHLWAFLSLSTPQYHVEATRLLIHLQSAVYREELVTSTLVSLITNTEATSASLHAQCCDVPERFATLWTLCHNDSITTRDTEGMAAFYSTLRQSMVSVLSVLCGSLTVSYSSCRRWLQGTADLSTFFDCLTTEINQALNITQDSYVSTDVEKLERASYTMGTLYQLAAAQSDEQWLSFSRRRTSNPLDFEDFKSGAKGLHNLQISIMSLSCHVLKSHSISECREKADQILRLHQSGLRLVRLMFTRSNSEPVLAFNIDTWIVEQLTNPTVLGYTVYQSDLLDTLLLILSVKKESMNLEGTLTKLSSEEEFAAQEELATRLSQSLRRQKLCRQGEAEHAVHEPPEQLLSCLLNGIAQITVRPVIQKWVQVLCESIHLFHSTVFTATISIVEALCNQVHMCFSGISSLYENKSAIAGNFEFPLVCLLNGLDFVLACAHEKLITEEMMLSSSKSPDLQPGFFGSLVTGTVSSDPKHARMAVSNNRLTLMLCFQDTIKTCTRLWSWQVAGLGESSYNLASFQHSSQKIRGRSRKILEHLVAAEPMEAVETLTRVWLEAIGENDLVRSTTAMNLIHTLEGSKPRLTMLALINAVLSRTNPTVLEPTQRSTLSTNLQERDLITFMSAYAQSLEDDALDEIWKDCAIFLRDVLGNPMPHRHILVRLIDFIAVLGAKIEKTNASEELKIRKELRELFMRLLTAVFTIKPQNTSREKTAGIPLKIPKTRSDDFDAVEQVLDHNFSVLSSLLEESDSLVSVLTNVVSSAIAPVFRSRFFPQNLNWPTMSLLLKISRVPDASKIWKKEVHDAFGDAKFFASARDMAKAGWLPLLRQLALADKGILPEIQSRLSCPTSAGIMFGVGATTARLEADRKAQFNFRRIACLLLAAESETFVTELSILQSKLEEMLSASTASSPSSVTRAEIFMVIRAMCLVSSSGQLAGFWPILHLEFRAAFLSLSHHDRICPPGTYNNYSVLQACKLLDVLLLTNPEDFQAQQWLFVTDTLDATYRPDDWDPRALVDKVAQRMMEDGLPKSAFTAAQSPGHVALNLSDENQGNLRKPWLSGEKTRVCAESEIHDELLRPFFGQLSIDVYERTYSLGDADLESCKDDLVADLFNDRTFVGS